ncbi:hypothetical protein N656DRAFT_832961 [Canariomyces notabilis]|uniref:Uncharacterized protein n=1 Tax=Canariomyces notabilis TaxID=2074819 RepID=A0AAN6QCG1_9PEZI|nr:hypothetical protein N656DRAFT_832961 [Canariomyces arenarius]
MPRLIQALFTLSYCRGVTRKAPPPHSRTVAKPHLQAAPNPAARGMEARPDIEMGDSPPSSSPSPIQPIRQEDPPNQPIQPNKPNKPIQPNKPTSPNLQSSRHSSHQSSRLPSHPTARKLPDPPKQSKSTNQFLEVTAFNRLVAGLEALASENQAQAKFLAQEIQQAYRLACLQAAQLPRRPTAPPTTPPLDLPSLRKVVAEESPTTERDFSD